MTTLDEDAKRLGIKRPKIDYMSYTRPDGITVVKMTPESEILWCRYINSVTQAKIALAQ